MQIRELRIRDVGVIDDVTVELSPGLTVVSGETGAGKTMVVGALQLLRGERADVDQVRAGASQALVEARFAPPPPDVLSPGSISPTQWAGQLSRGPNSHSSSGRK
ncbi:MAG: hypothetical protein BRC31_02520 [Actinobacteria bacterium QS_5_72_10]|nr:MAG: hypothetical protein BRC31_02520 [Actinobacteria bacterium QS_5_72_10]